MTSLCESYESNIFKLLPTFAPAVAAAAAVGGCGVPCTAVVVVVVVVPFVSTIDPLYRKLAPR